MGFRPLTADESKGKLYRVKDADDPKTGEVGKIWDDGERKGLQYMDAWKIKERIVGERKSRTAYVDEMTSALPIVPFTPIDLDKIPVQQPLGYDPHLEEMKAKAKAAASGAAAEAQVRADLAAARQKAADAAAAATAAAAQIKPMDDDDGLDADDGAPGDDINVADLLGDDDGGSLPSAADIEHARKLAEAESPVPVPPSIASDTQPKL